MGRKRRKPILLPKVAITGIADKGKSVGKAEDGRVVFVEAVVPGDVVAVQVNKKRKGTLFGYATQTHQYSIDRVDPFCKHFEHCGGCKWQQMTYHAQLQHKQKVVESAITRIGKIEIDQLETILPAVEQTYYRNKMEYSFSNKRWLTSEEIASGISNLENVLGFHRAGAYDKIVNIEHCFLQPEPSNQIRNFVRALANRMELSFYDAKTNQGFLRNMIIRVSSLQEVMVIVAFQADRAELYQPFLDELIRAFPAITALFYCINPKVNDYLMDLEMIPYHGKTYIQERMGHVLFNIGPKSFFQTNTRQGERLYDTVVEFANLQGHENVYDLYTGLGSIALYVAQHAKQVVGIEEIAAAIEDAKTNAQLNNIQNTIFYAGDVKDILTTEFAQLHSKPDVLITDPPRAGMHPKVVKMLLELAPPKIVYVSCNPATQARDLNLLSEKYRIPRLRPVDMFPHTSHIESVALLELSGTH